MSKRLNVVLIVAILCSLVAACGGGGGTAATPTAGSSSSGVGGSSGGGGIGGATAPIAVPPIINPGTHLIPIAPISPVAPTTQAMINPALAGKLYFNGSSEFVEMAMIGLLTRCCI